MRYLGLITARGGSKRIPGKNIKLLGGYPLIWYTIHQALNSKLHDKYAGNMIALSTDDPMILAAAQVYFTATNSNGVIVPIARPAALAQDDTEHIRVVRHALEQFAPGAFDAVVTLHPTSPFRHSGDIDAIMNMFDRSGKNTVGVGPDGKRNAALYVTPVAELLEEERTKIYNPDSIGCSMSENGSLDINTMEDWARAEEVALKDKIIWTV